MYVCMYVQLLQKLQTINSYDHITIAVCVVCVQKNNWQLSYSWLLNTQNSIAPILLSNIRNIIAPKITAVNSCDHTAIAVYEAFVQKNNKQLSYSWLLKH